MPKVLQALTLLLLFLPPSIVSAQSYAFWNRCGDTLNTALYPRDSFEVKTIVYPHGATEIALHILHAAFFPEDDQVVDQVWLEQRKGDHLIRSKYLGDISSGESGVGIPEKQWIAPFFCVYDASEFTGTFHLLHENGAWFELPGGELATDKSGQFLYTFVPAECGGCPVGKMDLKTMQITRKMSDGMSSPWEEFADAEQVMYWFGDAGWVRWE
jgi:hypothetical protein